MECMCAFDFSISYIIAYLNFWLSLSLSVSFTQANDIPFNLVDFLNQPVYAVFRLESSNFVYTRIKNGGASSTSIGSTTNSLSAL